MANTISGISSSVLPVDVQAIDEAVNTAASTAARPTNSQAVSASESDRTDLSGAGKILGQALRTVGSISSFRADFVNEIKARIASGSYQPDPSAVAKTVANALSQES